MKVPKHMAYLDAKFTKKKKHAASSTSALNGNSTSSLAQHTATAVAESTESKVSPNNNFHIKYTPMQLYPKMLKVKVIDKQLGKKF